MGMIGDTEPWPQSLTELVVHDGESVGYTLSTYSSMYQKIISRVPGLCSLRFQHIREEN
jgi:hypothetical protein